MATMTLDTRMRRMHRDVSARSKARNIRYGFSAELFEALYLAQDGRCAVSGRKMLIRAKPADCRTDPLAPSPDRIQKDGGYVHGNVRLVCIRVNEMRSDFSDRDLFGWCRAITKAQWGKGMTQAAA
jgi:hypothetical protein